MNSLFKILRYSLKYLPKLLDRCNCNIDFDFLCTNVPITLLSSFKYHIINTLSVNVWTSVEAVYTVYTFYIIVIVSSLDYQINKCIGNTMTMPAFVPVMALCMMVI